MIDCYCTRSYPDPVTNCSATIGCGSIAWFAKDSTLSTFVQGGVCVADNSPFASYTPVLCQCPTYKADIAPCTCALSAGSTTTLTLACANQKKTDDDIAHVVSMFTPGAVVDTVDLSVNALTKVPQGLASTFPQLAYLYMANNSVTAIKAGDLPRLSSIKTYLLDFSNNQITAVQDGALPCEYNTAKYF